MVKIITVNENLFANNISQAEQIRMMLKQNHCYMINVMSSPGSGKTTLLTKLIETLKEDFRILVMDVDIDTTLDSDRLAKSGVESIQIHNGGLCHIDADMVSNTFIQGNIDLSQYDLIILENIGNLVCPAEFDTGGNLNMMLLSIPEGDDKPLKYPLMFQVSNLVVFSKIDTMPIFNFDIEKCKQSILELNPSVNFISTSAKKGVGLEELKEYILQRVKECK